MKISTFKRKKKFIVISLIVLIMNLFSVNVMAETLPGADTKVNLNLTGVSLRDAFRALAEVAEMNIITDNSVQGNVTINLQDITFLEAVELLAKTNGLSYRIVGNTVLVASPSQIKAGFSEKVTKVFKLMNSEPAEVKKSLNLLVGGNSIRVDDRTNSLIITAYKSQIPQIERVINKLDRAKKQVVLQARIEEISRDELEKMGIDWSFDTLKLIGNDGKAMKTLEMFGESVDNATVRYSSILDLLESNNKADLLANPQIATIDGKTASIKIGDQVPIVTTDVDSDGSKSSTVEFKDVGINLKITPRVTNNNKIVVKVRPEVSTVTGYTDTTPEYPIVSTRTAETNVRIQDGKTFAIGGLIKDEEIKAMSKVPLLSELPILGKLFQSESTEIAKRELIIFITPKIISDGEEVDTQLKNEFKSTEEEYNNESNVKEGQDNNSQNNLIDKKGLKNTKIVPFEYKVKGTDTFWSISKQFKISFAAIMEHNGIKYMRPLSAGEVLTIPVPANNYYKVKEGDTVKDIAEEYNIFTQPIRQINSIKSLDGKAGMKLVLPVEVKEEDRCDFNEENKVDEVKASKDTEIESKDKNKKNKGEKSNNEEVKKQDEAESSTTKHSSS